MTTSPKYLLIVDSKHKIALDDKVLELLLYDIFQVQPAKGFLETLKQAGISMTAKFSLSSKQMFWNWDGKLSKNERIAILSDNAYKPQKKILLFLLEQLFECKLPDIFPKLIKGSEVVFSDDPRLQEWHLLGNTAFNIETPYVQHPADSRCFLPVSDFHDLLYSDKWAEFKTLMSLLGAKRIQCCELNTRSFQSHTDIGLNDPTNYTDIGAELEASNTSSQQYKSIDIAIAPGGPPALNEEPRWLYRESEWKGLAEQRLANLDKQHYVICFQYQEDFGVTADVSATLIELGLKANTKLSKMKEGITSCSVEFFTRKDYESAGISKADIQKSVNRAKKRLFPFSKQV